MAEFWQSVLDYLREHAGVLVRVAVTLLGSWLFLAGLDSRLGHWALYGVVMALALYTHLTAAFVLASHGLIYLGLLARKAWVWRRLHRSDLLPLAGFALTGLFSVQLYALILPQVLAHFRRGQGGPRG